MSDLKIAVFAGSFDPITKGHEALVIKALPLFDKIIIGIGNNVEKKYMFSTEQRLSHIHSCFKTHKKIEAQFYEGLTVNFCKQVGATYMIRGLRNSSDFEFEKNIAQMNKAISGIETAFFITDPEFSAISSTVIRDIYRNGGDIRPFIPNGIDL
jgi:pantetheine-phosphate adenylyltransferase